MEIGGFDWDVPEFAPSGTYDITFTADGTWNGGKVMQVFCVVIEFIL